MQANLLRSQMALKGVTQVELAQACGITENTLSNKINGKTSFRSEEIVTICETLGIEDPKLKADIFLT
jgi:transcriptional regulator with XRE-family HTH domain